MIKLLEAHYRGGHQIDLVFSDGQHGVFNVKAYLATRHGPLLGPLQDEIYLQRFFYRCRGLYVGLMALSYL